VRGLPRLRAVGRAVAPIVRRRPPKTAIPATPSASPPSRRLSWSTSRPVRTQHGRRRNWALTPVRD